MIESIIFVSPIGEKEVARFRRTAYSDYSVVRFAQQCIYNMAASEAIAADYNIIRHVANVRKIFGLAEW